MTIADAVPLSGFIFDEGSPFTTAEKHRLSALRLFEFASSLARMAGEATLNEPQNVDQTIGLYAASAQILAQANDPPVPAPHGPGLRGRRLVVGALALPVRALGWALRGRHTKHMSTLARLDFVRP